MNDFEQLVDFMKRLNKYPGNPVTHADLVHTIHLVIGMINQEVSDTADVIIATERSKNGK